MATALDIIKRSLRLIGAIPSGETATSNETDDALQALQQLIDSWSSDGIAVPYVTTESFPLVSGQSVYTYGPGGDFDSTRPIDILSAYIRNSNNSDFQITLVSRRYYNNLIRKGVSSVPRTLWYNDEYPLGKVHIDYSPSQPYTLYMDTIKPLTTPSALTTSIVFPPGWDRALAFNLAVEMAPEYERSAPAEVVSVAVAAKNSIDRRGIEPETMAIEQGATHIYNIYTD